MVSDKNYLVKCNDYDFEREADNATYAMNLLQWYKNETGHFNNYLKTPGPGPSSETKT